MRYLIAGLLVCAACSSDKSSTGPAAVASVQLNAANNVIAVGGTTTFTATALDASGNALAGQTVNWTTSNAAVASVSGGLVTGLAVGTATITAAVANKAQAQIVTVTAVVSASCTAGNTLSLAVGAVHVLTDAEKASLCVSGGSAGSEYVLVPFKGDTSSNLTPVSITSIGTLTATGAPTAAASTSASAMLIPSMRRGGSLLSRSAVHGTFGAAFERQLRAKERTQLTPIVNATSRSSLRASMQRSALKRSSILNLASSPTVGTYFQINANGDDACTNRINHAARVAAVSKAAIIVVDSTAPAGGFTDADYASLAATFDTVVFALDTSAFGAPADLDGNGKILIFFTQTVNQLTPPGSNGYVGGFFFARDLFPLTDPDPTKACAGSNVGEMFYVPVLDPNQVYNEFFTDKTQFSIDLVGTLAHEFQHLINASRRLYVVQTDNWDEDVWLNEGMSHIAEELLYFHESGFAPKQFLTLKAVTANTTVLNAINDYQLQNLFRLDDYLFATTINSPYAQNDSLETRGATYELLRYAMDESTGTNSFYLHALINTQQTGVANFNAVFGATFPNIFAAVQQQVLANFFNGSGITIDAKYSFPSWNYRDVIGNGIDSPADNPLITRQLAGAGAVTFSLTGGGVGYGRFRIIGNGTANITSASGSGVVPANVTMILVRTL